MCWHLSVPTEIFNVIALEFGISVAVKHFFHRTGVEILSSWKRRAELGRGNRGRVHNRRKGRMQTRGNQRKYCFEVFASSLKGSALDGRENIKQPSMLQHERIDEQLLL